MTAARSGRLAGKAAVVVGAGQTPGDTIGNGRATALLFAREGARVLCVDRDLARAEETAALIVAEGGEAQAFAANIMREADCQALVAAAVAAFGRIDVLHNNVGGGGGDGSVEVLTEGIFTRLVQDDPELTGVAGLDRYEISAYGKPGHRCRHS